MSVLSVTEQIALDGSHQLQTNGRLARKYTRKFKVYCSLPNETANTPLLYSSIPAMLTSYPGDSYARVIDKKATQTASDPKVWDVTVEYDSTFAFDPADWDAIPTNRPAIWEFTFEKATKAIRYDLDDNEIANSAGTPLNPPLELDYGIPVIKVSKNKSSFTFSSIATLQECVNSDTWQGFAPHTVKIRGVEVKQVYEQGLFYFAYSWTLAVKWDKWRPYKVLDMGYSELDTAGKPKLIRDQYGAPLPAPSLLDGDGKKLPDGDDPVYLDFNLNREVAFTGLIP